MNREANEWVCGDNGTACVVSASAHASARFQLHLSCAGGTACRPHCGRSVGGRELLVAANVIQAAGLAVLAIAHPPAVFW